MTTAASTAPTGPVRVPVTLLDLDDVATRARSRTAAMRAGNPGYGVTSEAMNTVGLLGEHAVARWLTNLGMIAHLGNDRDYRHGDGDVILVRDTGHLPRGTMWSNGASVEVKTSRFSDWKRIGRVLNAQQLSRISAWAIVWCVVADALPTTSVIVMGWLPIDQVRAAASNEPLTIHGKDSLRVHEPLLPPSLFPDWLAAQPFVPF